MRTLRQAKYLFIFMLLFGTPLVNAALPASIYGEDLPSLAPMLETVQSSIVNISTTTTIRAQEHPLMQDPFFRRFFNTPRQQRPKNSLGSGVIVDADKGHVITNHHVIDKADKITVTTKDGREMKAQLIGSDPASDIAVIKVTPDNLTEIPVGVSADLRVGDFVVAIGSPFGLSQTVTAGIVSALGRSGLGIEGYEDFIQTDASINPGNSGGALVNLRGELVGINTAILSRSGGSIGIGLSIPVDMAVSLMNQLLEYGDVRRGLLGVRMQDLTPVLADAFGVPGKNGAVVADVIDGSAAENIGIREGDVIVKFNNRQIENSADLRNAVGLLRPDSSAVIEYYRDSSLIKQEVTIKDNDYLASTSEAGHHRFEGARFKNMNSNEYGQIVVVESLKPGSPAAFTGLETGDIILGINQRKVHSIEEMNKIVNMFSGTLLIKLVRGRQSQFLVIQ